MAQLNAQSARHAAPKISIQGTDISEEISARLISLTVTTHEEDIADDVDLAIHDRDGTILKSWAAALVPKIPETAQVETSGQLNPAPGNAGIPDDRDQFCTPFGADLFDMPNPSPGARPVSSLPPGAEVTKLMEMPSRVKNSESYSAVKLNETGQVGYLKTSALQKLVKISEETKKANDERKKLLDATAEAAASGSLEAQAVLKNPTLLDAQRGIRICVDSAPVYASPDAAGTPIGALPLGTETQVFANRGEAGNFYEVQVGAVRGYIVENLAQEITIPGWRPPGWEDQNADSLHSEPPPKWEVPADPCATMSVAVARKNWSAPDTEDIADFGDFELDNPEFSFPPAAFHLRGVALAFKGALRQTKRSKIWTNIKLSEIAGAVTGRAGVGLNFLSDNDPSYPSIEQDNISDIDFLSELCHNSGISLKSAGGMLILFDQTKAESEDPVLIISPDSKLLEGTSTLSFNTYGQYDSCHVVCENNDGSSIEATAKISDTGGSSAATGQCLEIKARVNSVGEAMALAEKRLRRENKNAMTAEISLPGNPTLVAGKTIALENFGPWTGKYMIKRARHTLDNSGYRVALSLRACLGGY